MLIPEFTLTELCDRVGVSPRTVRYYISQGLLASPERRGPGATYRGEHQVDHHLPEPLCGA